MNPEILVGYDPRSDARAPLAVASTLATNFDAPLVLASVFPPVPFLGDVKDGAFWADQRADLERAQDRAAAALSASAPAITTRVIEGHVPAHGMAAAAFDDEPAVVVLGSRTGTTSGLVTAGRTAHDVLRTVRCAVCVAPAGAVPDELDTVAAAVTDTPEAFDALQAAALLARRAGARLRVFAVSPTNHWRAAIGESLNNLLGPLGSTASGAIETVIGDPADALVAASAAVGLLVMPVHGYPMQAVPGAGSVSHRVLAGARCPVIVLPRGAELGVQGKLGV